LLFIGIRDVKPLKLLDHKKDSLQIQCLDTYS
jgi:hypothetical protein